MLDCVKLWIGLIWLETRIYSVFLSVKIYLRTAPSYNFLKQMSNKSCETFIFFSIPQRSSNYTFGDANPLPPLQPSGQGLWVRPVVYCLHIVYVTEKGTHVWHLLSKNTKGIQVSEGFSKGYKSGLLSILIWNFQEIKREIINWPRR